MTVTHDLSRASSTGGGGGGGNKQVYPEELTMEMENGVTSDDDSDSISSKSMDSKSLIPSPEEVKDPTVQKVALIVILMLGSWLKYVDLHSTHAWFLYFNHMIGML